MLTYRNGTNFVKPGTNNRESGSGRDAYVPPRQLWPKTSRGLVQATQSAVRVSTVPSPLESQLRQSTVLCLVPVPVITQGHRPVTDDN